MRNVLKEAGARRTSRLAIRRTTRQLGNQGWSASFWNRLRPATGTNTSYVQSPPHSTILDVPASLALKGMPSGGFTLLQGLGFTERIDHFRHGAVAHCSIAIFAATLVSDALGKMQRVAVRPTRVGFHRGAARPTYDR
ncbi:MAG: hypothetical protein ACREPM_22295, partial [Gemmatimonadaceae bacterium]